MPHQVPTELLMPGQPVVLGLPEHLSLQDDCKPWRWDAGTHTGSTVVSHGQTRSGAGQHALLVPTPHRDPGLSPPGCLGKPTRPSAQGAADAGRASLGKPSTRTGQPAPLLRTVVIKEALPAHAHGEDTPRCDLCSVTAHPVPSLIRAHRALLKTKPKLNIKHLNCQHQPAWPGPRTNSGSGECGAGRRVVPATHPPGPPRPALKGGLRGRCRGAGVRSVRGPRWGRRSCSSCS